jgi:hypothetical protein
MTMERWFLASFVVACTAVTSSGCRDAPLAENVDSNMAPIAHAGPMQAVEYAGSPVTVKLDGSGSIDPDGTIVTYRWLSGNSPDGGTGRSGPNPADEISPTVTLDAGVWVFTLWVIDDEGAASEPSAVMIKVGNELTPGAIECIDKSLQTISQACRTCLCTVSDACVDAIKACDDKCWAFYTCIQQQCGDTIGDTAALTDCVRANCTAFFSGVGKYMPLETCIIPPPCADPCSASALGT